MYSQNMWILICYIWNMHRTIDSGLVSPDQEINKNTLPINTSNLAILFFDMWQAQYLQWYSIHTSPLISSRADSKHSAGIVTIRITSSENVAEVQMNNDYR